GLGGEHVAALGGHSLEDPSYLRRALALGKDHLQHARAHAPVMVDLGKAQVFKRHVPQPSNSFVGRDEAGSNFLKQFAESEWIHGGEFRLSPNTYLTTEAQRHGEKQVHPKPSQKR